MAYLVPENWACISGNNGMEGVEVDGAFLMSLLEESQYEGNDEERLNSLIQSLQAEISPVSTQEPESASEEEEEDSQLGSPEVSDRFGSLCSAIPDVDFNWIDMEIVPSSPSNDMNWYMDRYVDEIGSVDVTDYAEICNGVEFEDSLWQEAYDTVMFQGSVGNFQM